MRANAARFEATPPWKTILPPRGLLPYDLVEVVAHDREGEARVDLYLSGDFPKEVLLERKNRLAKLTADLKKEQAELSVFQQQLTYSDEKIATIEDFCTNIRERLDTLTFDGKRRILEMLDVRGTLAIENDERVIYVSCLIAPQPVSLALILPLSSSHGQNTIALTVRVILDRLHEKGSQVSLAEMLFSQTNLAGVG